MKTNSHTHTKLCKHSKGTAEDYVKGDVHKGLYILGMSDHTPYPDNRFGYRMEFNELKEYIKKVQKAKVTYGHQIQLYCGLEIEYNPNMHDYYHQLKDMGIKYLVLGQHLLCKTFNIYKCIWT